MSRKSCGHSIITLRYGLSWPGSIIPLSLGTRLWKYSSPRRQTRPKTCSLGVFFFKVFVHTVRIAWRLRTRREHVYQLCEFRSRVPTLQLLTFFQGSPHGRPDWGTGREPRREPG